MTDKRKRKLIKGLAAGGGVAAVAEQWVTPVVESVMLPAHAQTTPCRDLSVSLPNPTRVTCPTGQGSCIHEVDVEVENVGINDSGPYSILVMLDIGLSKSETRAGPAAGATDSFTVMLGPGNNCYETNCTTTATVDLKGGVIDCNVRNNTTERVDEG